MYRKSLLLTLVITFMILSCDKQEDIRPATSQNPDLVSKSKYTRTELPDDVSRLFIARENVSSDTAIVFVQGGPSTHLASDGLSSFPGYKNYCNIYVHQSQTYNSEIIIDDFSLQNAESEIEVTLKILFRVINHLKSEGKVVFVTGSSYGAFLVTKYLAEFGNNVDKFIILVGRLDMEEEVWQGYLSKKYYSFPDAVNPVFDPSFVSSSTIDDVLFTLIGAVTRERYTESLEIVDMKNVLYVYGTNDKNVGRLKPHEISFLNDKGVDLYKIEDGGHSSPFESPHAEIIWAKIVN